MFSDGHPSINLQLSRTLVSPEVSFFHFALSRLAPQLRFS
jgi:hypothetical protein